MINQNLITMHILISLTRNKTEDMEAVIRIVLFQLVTYGSGIPVTGLIRVVLTDASYSGRVSKSSSALLSSQCHLSTICLRCHNSRNMVAEIYILNM